MNESGETRKGFREEECREKLGETVMEINKNNSDFKSIKYRKGTERLNWCTEVKCLLLFAPIF